jgi:hypothetical protein
LQYYLNVLRNAQRLALIAAISALTAGLTIITTKSALAEFEIQESQVEKGEVEIEYRGAVHWDFPRAERQEAEEGEEGGALEEEEEGEFLRQSHDIELQWSVTDRWMFSTALSADEPLDSDFDVSSVEVELQYELIEREGNGLGLAFLGAYGFATRSGEADEIEFGPIVELASGKGLLTTNTFFTSQVGDNRETDGLGFEYGWRAQYGLSKKWGLGVEMFGEIEDLSHAGSFNDQQHSIGPTVFFNPGGDDDDDDDDNGDGNGTHNNNKILGPAKAEFSMNVGFQLGLTDLTSDTALKFQGALEF